MSQSFGFPTLENIWFGLVWFFPLNKLLHALKPAVCSWYGKGDMCW